MNKGLLVYNKEFGRGIVNKISPSGSLVEVRFKHFGYQVVLSGSLTQVK